MGYHRCPKCGEVVDDAAEKCPRCGLRFEDHEGCRNEHTRYAMNSRIYERGKEAAVKFIPRSLVTLILLGLSVFLLIDGIIKGYKTYYIVIASVLAFIFLIFFIRYIFIIVLSLKDPYKAGLKVREPSPAAKARKKFDKEVGTWIVMDTIADVLVDLTKK